MIALTRAPATVPPGRRIYAIGDIHGCDAQLANLHAIIAEDIARRPVDHPMLLHIGDYVDRGADTAGVLARLLRGPAIDHRAARIMIATEVSGNRVRRAPYSGLRSTRPLR